MEYQNIFLTKDEKRDSILRKKLIKESLEVPDDYVPARRVFNYRKGDK